MKNTTARFVRTGIAAVATVGLLAATPVGAGAAGRGGHRHHGHHHHSITAAQKTCLADHGFVFGHRAPRPVFHDPAVRAQFLAALRDCGILPPAPVPTTTTTTTAPPIVSN